MNKLNYYTNKILPRIQLVILLVLISCIHSFAQIPEASRSMLTPNAAALGEYGEVPISPFTGLPQIVIPLYELKTGVHSVPISLSYHAGGVRPDQHPGWTGMGWTLQAGGCISRVVKDSIDEYHNPIQTNGVPFNYRSHCGFYYRDSILNKDYWNTPQMISDIENQHYAFFDSEPDIFNFDFLDYHGKFFMGHDHQWRVQCDKPIEVVFTDDFIDPYDYFKKTGRTNTVNDGWSHAFKKFTLISEDGTRYVFGDDPDAIEYSMPFFEQYSARFHASTWYLTKIIYTDGREVSFHYSRNGYNLTAQMEISQTKIISYQWKGSQGNWNSSQFSFYNPNNYEIYNGHLFWPTYLDSITSPYETVTLQRSVAKDLQYDFESIIKSQMTFSQQTIGPGVVPIVFNCGEDSLFSALKWYKLTSLQVKSSGRTIHTYSFGYNDTGTPYSQRLLLLSVGERTLNERKEYRFSYYHPELLPDYLTNETDHWGFYNGFHSDMTHFLNYHVSKRPSGDDKGLYGTLSRITYPTGGYTDFIYEPHSYSMRVGQLRNTCEELDADSVAGGLRIKKIISRASEDSPEVTKEYFYVKDYGKNSNVSRSSGVLGTRAQYMFTNYHPLVAGNMDSVRLDIFSAQSLLPGTENACGAHIGYSEVAERLSDGSYTVFKYTNIDNGHTDDLCDFSYQPARLMHEPYNSRAFERGLLTSQERHGIVNDLPVLKEKLIIEYERDDTTSLNYARALKIDRKNISAMHHVLPVAYYYEGAAYRNLSYLLRKKTETDSIFDGENGFQTAHTKKIDYNYYTYNKLPSAITTIVNGTEKHRTTFSYPSSNANADMFNAHIYSPVLERIESRMMGPLNQTISKTRNNYSQNMVRPSSIESAVATNPYECRSQYVYDSKMNPIYEITDSTNHTVYLWGYNYRYIVAVIENATLSQVSSVIGNIETFESASVPNLALLDPLRQQADILVSTYTYSPSIGVITHTDPSGRVTRFRYDEFKRLKTIMDEEGHIQKIFKYFYKK